MSAGSAHDGRRKTTRVGWAVLARRLRCVPRRAPVTVSDGSRLAGFLEDGRASGLVSRLFLQGQPGRARSPRHHRRHPRRRHVRHHHPGHAPLLSARTPDATANDWFWARSPIHTADEMFIPLMFKIHLMMPIVLAVILFWFAWRVVNIPAFADFLIATEAEMNKVSWTNRRRLFQDTIVVLVTVFLFTGFLFVVDVIWIKVLSAPGHQVLADRSARRAAKAAGKGRVVTTSPQHPGNGSHDHGKCRRPNERCMPPPLRRAVRAAARPPAVATEDAAPTTPCRPKPEQTAMVRRQGAERPRGVDQGSDRTPRQDRRACKTASGRSSSRPKRSARCARTNA